MAPTFPLQTVLNYRQQRVEMLQLELAQMIAAERDLQLQKEQAQRMEQSLLDDLGRARLGLLDMTSIHHLYQQLRPAQRRIEELETAILAMRPQIETKRAELVKADQAKETLEQIKSNAEARWQSEMTHQETLEQDDQYIARAFRQSGGA